MKILLIEPGGYAATFQYTHNLANALARRQHHVTLITGVNYETKSYTRHYEVLEIFHRFIPRPVRIIKMLFHVKALQPDIIHIQGHLHPGSYLLIVNLLQWVSQAAFVYTAQDVIPKNLKRHHMWALRRLYSKARHIFVNARENMLELLERFPLTDPARITVIPLADLSAFVREEHPPSTCKNNHTGKVVLFFGNIEARKGLMHLLRAFPEVIKKVPEAHLHIAGKPFENMDPYYQEIERLGIANHLTLYDNYVPLEQLPSVFESAELVVVPYTLGWNSGVIATAYAYCKPVIASDLQGVREVVEDGKTGILVPPGDEPGLAKAIVTLLTDDALRTRMAEAISKSNTLNSWPAIASRTEEIYQSVL